MTLSNAPLLLIAVTLLGACEDTPAEPDPQDYDPDIQPEDFVAGVDNPLFPLVPGTVLTYESDTEDGLETIVFEVLSTTRVVNGVTATIVHDEVFLEGELIEDTFDWYAQDEEGNVWYLGEDTKELEDGEVVSTDGSFEWGVDGALPGIVMWADPGEHVGEEYRQEYYVEQAEDWGKVIATGETVTVPTGTYTGCVHTEDWNALEPEAGREDKWYCPGIGFVYETKQLSPEIVELVEIETP